MAKGQKRSNREAKKPKQDPKQKKTGSDAVPASVNPFGTGKKGGAPHKQSQTKR